MNTLKDNKALGAVRKAINSNSVIVAFVTIFILATIIKGGDFFSAQNFVNILRNNSVIGIIALGMTLIIVSGGIDLSVGSTLVGVGAINDPHHRFNGQHRNRHRSGRHRGRAFGSVDRRAGHKRKGFLPLL